MKIGVLPDTSCLEHAVTSHCIGLFIFENSIPATKDQNEKTPIPDFDLCRIPDRRRSVANVGPSCICPRPAAVNPPLDAAASGYARDGAIVADNNVRQQQLFRRACNTDGRVQSGLSGSNHPDAERRSGGRGTKYVTPKHPRGRGLLSVSG